MPSGRTHDVAGLLTTAPLAAVAYSAGTLASGDPSEAVVLAAACAGSHVIGTLLFSPDLDLNSSIYRRWGPLRLIWYPYQKLIRHRSKLSHSTLSGPFRLMYFILALIFIYLTLIGITKGLENFFGSGEAKERVVNIFWSLIIIIKAYPLFVAFVFAGFATSSALHVLMDNVWSTLRRF